jgi:glycosyltransferase involved in cell wall biosynthesis
VSDFEADFFASRLRIPRHRFAVIANGSNLPRCAPEATPADRTLVLSVGRLERYKGHHRVIEALPYVSERVPDVRLRIVGTGPYEPELRRLVQDMHLADKVEIGPVSASDRAGMASLLSQASLVALLSEYEAHSIAVLEALAMRKPVLVADTSGLHEFAERGQARAIPLNSSPREVAAALIEQLTDPIASSQVALPTWDECAAGVLQVYQSVVDRDRCRAQVRQKLLATQNGAP